MHKSVVLCVDDEKMVLTSLKAQIKRLFGGEYGVEVAESAEEALEIIEELESSSTPLMLVVSDQIMPGMKGDELLAKIHKKLPYTLNILLTGQADLDAISRAINNARLYKYIPKPWDESELNKAILDAVSIYRNEAR